MAPESREGAHTLRPCPAPDTAEHTHPSHHLAQMILRKGVIVPKMRKKSLRRGEALAQSHTSHIKELDSNPGLRIPWHGLGSGPGSTDNGLCDLDNYLPLSGPL